MVVCQVTLFKEALSTVRVPLIIALKASYCNVWGAVTMSSILQYVTVALKCDADDSAGWMVGGESKMWHCVRNRRWNCGVGVLT